MRQVKMQLGIHLCNIKYNQRTISIRTLYIFIKSWVTKTLTQSYKGKIMSALNLAV